MRHVEDMIRDQRLLFILTAIAISGLLIGLLLAYDLTVGLALLIFGIAILAFSAEKAVEHSVNIASALGMSPLMIGLLIVSLGTDFPEITNSIVSSALGHGNINVGDSFGSVLAQMTLILGLIALIGGTFKVDREEVTVIGACEVLALIASVSMVEKGYISRMNAFFLVASWPLLLLIIRNVMKKPSTIIQHTGQGFPYHLVLAVLGFVGVAAGSFIVIESVIGLSAVLQIPEYFISFFIVAVGTSLPELVVDLTAVRRRQYEIAIGDVIGSSIIDAGFSVGIGPLFFPTTVSGGIAEITGLYALLCSAIVLSLLAFRQKLDNKAGTLFVALYFLAYATIYI